MYGRFGIILGSFILVVGLSTTSAGDSQAMTSYPLPNPMGGLSALPFLTNAETRSISAEIERVSAFVKKGNALSPPIGFGRGYDVMA